MEIRTGSIQEWSQKIKAAGESVLGEWGLIAIVFLVAIASFGLGRFSALEDVRPPVSIKEVPSEAVPRGMYLGGLILASYSGSVYYYPWCQGAGKIAPGNQRWFASEQEAQKAGYTASKSCKGLQ